MSANEELLKRIRESLETAQKTLKIKEKIEEEINHILNEINKMLGNSVTFELLDYDGEKGFSSSGKVIYISKSGHQFGESFILFGIGINENTGYPVNVETVRSIYNCNDDSELKGCIGDIITEDQNSMLIVKIASSEPPIPF